MVAAVIDWYALQQVPLQAAFLSAGTTLLVLFLGVWLNALANRRNTLKASRDAQKLDIYKTMLEKIDSASAAQLAADGYLRGAVMAVGIHADMVGQGLTATPPKHRFPEFSRLHQEQNARLSDIHILLEQWAIIDHRLKAFRMAFGYQSNATTLAAMPLNEKLIRLLPTENPQGGMFPYIAPQGRNLAELSEVADRYHRESGLIGAYISDLNVELQPLLLGHLFGRQIVPRDAPDPAQFTIRLDRRRQIIRHFESTEFFQNGARTDRELRELHKKQRPKRRWWHRVGSLRDC